MINVSKKYLETMENRRDFYATAEITFADGREKSVEKKDLFISGNSVVTSPELSSFPLGVFVSRMITLSLVNDDDRWSDYDFYGAKISLKTKFDLDDGTTETINVGTFTVITPESYGTTVGITAMDDSYKADKEYSTNLPYPAPARLVLMESCYSCGIILKTPSFLNSDFAIPTKPENITHRQLIGLIAMLACGNAVMDEYNRLSIKSYDFFGFTGDLDGGVFDLAKPYETGDSADGGSFLPWSDGDNFDGGEFGDRNNVHVLHEFKSGLTVGVDDVVITGVQMVGEDADKNTSVHLYGEQGYVLQLDNRIAVGKEAEAVRLIGKNIVGLRFRPFSGDHIAYPLAEFMDLAYVSDLRNNVYQTVITDISFNYFGYTTLKCSADSPIRNSSTYYGNETKAIVEARKLVEQEKTDRELAVENLANQLANSSGLFMTPEVQEDRSTIYYMHDKPMLAESKIVWKLTANAFGISTDGGKTYPYGLDASGMAILNRIYTIGLNADYITAGAFEIRKGDKVMVLMDKDTGQVILRPDTFELSDGSTIGSIAEGKANNAVNNMSQTDVLDKLTRGGADKGIYLQNGNLYISFSAARGGELTLGGASNGNGRLSIRDASGKEVGYIDNTGVNFEKGTFSGTVSAGAITGSEIDGGTITGSQIDGVIVTGSTISGGVIESPSSLNNDYKLQISNSKINYINPLISGNPGEIYFEPSVIMGESGSEQISNMILSAYQITIKATHRLGITLSSNGTAKYELGSLTHYLTGDTYIVGNLRVFGDISYDGTCKQYNQPSDERLKTAILPSTIDALKTINGIQTYKFDWVQTGEHEDVKFVAQQLETVNPAFVHVDKDTGCYGVKPLEMIPYLVKAVQELSEQVESLQAEIAELKGQSIERTSRKARTEWKPTPYTMEEKREFVNTLSKKRRNAANGD